METYNGDISGQLLWEFITDKESVYYLQNPMILSQFGGWVKSERVWDSCSCVCHDSTYTFCWNCIDTREEHKSYSNKDDLKRTLHTIIMDRSNLILMILWLEDKAPLMDPYIEEITFVWEGHTVEIHGEYRAYYGDNYQDLGLYVLLKQIKYYFETCDQDICQFVIFE